MAKLRKMLGDIHWDICQDLMHLIETQSHHTLASWAIHYAKENYLPLYLESVKESCLENVIDECEEYLNQQCQLKAIKPLLKAARADEEYNQLAYTELHRAYVSLKDVAAKEEHPVKINWNC